MTSDRRPKKRVRTCPMCGERFYARTFYEHLQEYHANDESALMQALAKLAQRFINKGGRSK